MKELDFIGFDAARDVPPELDARIIGAAKHRAAQLHRRRLLLRRVTPLAAAALLLVSVAVIFMRPGDASAKRLTGSELLSLTDWSEVEQQSYNLSMDVYSGEIATDSVGEYLKGAII